MLERVLRSSGFPVLGPFWAYPQVVSLSLGRAHQSLSIIIYHSLSLSLMSSYTINLVMTGQAELQQLH
jgi:hypothetical protein